MDLLATQVYEDDEFVPTQKISYCSRQETMQIGVLRVGSDTYPIKQGINKIGRHSKCDILLNNQTVSKKHAEIEANSHDASAWICDLNSSNRTKLNNSILRPGRCYELKDGSVIEFGLVQAVYKACCTLDESSTLETPATNRLKQQLIIPGTPDSSLNNSSTAEENVSVIPATQAEKKGSVFRCPTLPARCSTSSSRKSGSVEVSLVDDSLDNSRSFDVRKKESIGEQKISIYDVETQKFESQDETNVDIHDVETQKICLSNLKNFAKTAHKKELEAQNKIDTQATVINIHDVETQHEVDIHNIKTPLKINNQNVTAQDDSNQSNEKYETPKVEENKELTTEVKNDVHNAKTRTFEATEGTSSLVDLDKSEDKVKDVEKSVPKNSQEYLQLSLATDFEDDYSKLNENRNLVSSPNLLESFVEDDEPPDEMELISSDPAKASRVSNSDVNEKSTDDENIFDAATQLNKIDESAFKHVTQRAECSRKFPLVNDSDETDEEGVFQSYSYNASKDSGKSRVSNSEDSITDEESLFTELALKQKQAVRNSFEARANQSKEIKSNNTSSADSEDLFDKLTQPVKNKKLSNTGDERNKVEQNFDAITQVIDMEETKVAGQIIDEDALGKEVDDMAPTQILPTTSKSFIKEANSAITAVKNKQDSDEKNVTQMVDDIPTQMIDTNEVALYIANDKPLNSSGLLKANDAEENSIENVDYEMAPTQRISDLEMHTFEVPTSSRTKSLLKKPKALSKVNLDDTIERNLNAMFEDVNEEHIEEGPQISTQVLRNVLQSSEGETKLPSVDSDSSTESKIKKSARRRKVETPTVDSASKSVSSEKSRKSKMKNTNNSDDSQNTEDYFSALTSRRKRNVLAELEDLNEDSERNFNENKEQEETMSKTVTNDQNSSVSVPSSKSASQNPSISKLSRKKGQEELKTAETNPNRDDTPKNDENESGRCSKHVDNEVSSVSLDEDILEGLPEVRISGTLSNPPSPSSSTSSEYKINVNYNKVRQVRIAPETKGALRKSLRKAVAHRNTENSEPYRSINTPNSSTIFRSLSNSFSNNIDVDKAPVHEKNDKKVNKKSMESVRKITPVSLRRSKENDSLSQLKPMNSIGMKEKMRQSPSVQSDRSRNCSIECVERSSVFQVGKEKVIEKAAAEPTKKNISNASRLGKRSFSMVDTIGNGESIKHKEDVNEEVPIAIKNRKRNTIAGRRQSVNIPEFTTKRNSPVSQSNPNSIRSNPPEESLVKQVVIKVIRLSPCTPTGSISPSTPTEFMNKTDNNYKTRQSQRTKRQTVASTLVKEVENIQTAETRKNSNEVAANKVESVAEEISCHVGEESQEVEMIMSGLLKEQGITALNAETEKDESKNTKGTKTKRSRKRKTASVRSESNSTRNSSTSSVISVSDNAYFEVPTSRAKRAKVSKNTSGTVNTTVDESINETKINNKPSTRSSRSRKNLITDSSTEEDTEITTTLNDTNKNSNPRGRSRKQKVQKIEIDKRENKDFIQETASSETNSSIESASVLLTPNRTRRSMSASLSVSSPFKVKHKILFTGIPSNDYSKLLTKLGASQVEDLAKCTVLVTDKVRRTVKFLCCLARSIPIVSVDWLVKSEKTGTFEDLESYILEDPAAEAKFGFKLKKSLKIAKEHKLLEGYTLVLTPNVAPPPLPELKNIIISCGGKPLIRPPSSWPQKSVIISREEDLANAKKFFAKAPKTVTVQSTEFLLTGILRQQLDFTKFKLM